MESLCISPVQAGIIFLSTANSSFILLRLRRSIKLWAVFLAIFRPAALVALGCFFLPFSSAAASPAVEPVVFEFVAVAAFLVPAEPLPPVFDFSLPAPLSPLVSCARGFIWMIFRDRVGGGGRANELSFASLAAEERRRAFTVSAGCMGNVAPGEVVTSGCDLVSVGETRDDEAVGEMRVASWIAGGGSSKESWKEASC